jgi:protein gp37
VAKNSSIEWTHHTFNPWWGCTKVSPGCKNCYAEAWARRVGLDVWGGRAARRFFSDAHWREPIRWNAEAITKGERRRVFCASMADVFEARSELDPWRERLWTLIESTPALDWLLLTKRPEQIAARVPWTERWPANVWLGTTAENQLWASRRIPILLKHPAAVRFVSCEPLIGPLDLSPWLGDGRRRGIDWVIAGGESGFKARPMNPEWPRKLRDQCSRAKIAFHFKQWGHWCPDDLDAPDGAKRQLVMNSDGSRIVLVRVGKHAAGRDLDGQTWDQFPIPKLGASESLRMAAIL